MIGLDFSGEWIRLVQAETALGERRLLKLFSKRISSKEPGRPTEEETSHAIRELFKEARVGKERLISAIPRYKVTTRLLRLPSTKESEIKGMVEFQAAKQLPYPKEEIITGFRTLGIDTEGYSRVMLVIAHQDVVNRHIRILDESGMLPEMVGFRSEAITNWFLANQKEGPGPEPAALIDLDFSSTEVQIIQDGNLVFTRSVPLGVSHLLERKSIQEATGKGGKFPSGEGKSIPSEEGLGWEYELIQETRRTFSAYEKEKVVRDKVAKVVLSGGISSIDGLEATFAKEFDLPVEVLAPLENISMGKKFVKPPDLERHPISYSAALGLALDADEMRIDLLPGAFKEERLRRKKRTELLATCLLVLLILGSMSFLAGKKFHDKQMNLRALDRRLAKIGPEAKRIEQMSMKLQVISDRLDVEGSALEVLRELYRIVPKEISIGIFIFEEDKGVTLRGTSKTMSDVFKFVTILEGSSFFEKVRARYASKRKVKEVEVTDFQINCPLVIKRGKPR